MLTTLSVLSLDQGAMTAAERQGLFGEGECADAPDRHALPEKEVRATLPAAARLLLAVRGAAARWRSGPAHPRGAGRAG